MTAKLVQKHSWLYNASHQEYNCYKDKNRPKSPQNFRDLFFITITFNRFEKEEQDDLLTKINSPMAFAFSKFIKHMANYCLGNFKLLNSKNGSFKLDMQISKKCSVSTSRATLEAIQSTSKAIQSTISHATTSALQKPKSHIDRSRTRHSHESIHRFINFI